MELYQHGDGNGFHVRKQLSFVGVRKQLSFFGTRTTGEVADLYTRLSGCR